MKRYLKCAAWMMAIMMLFSMASVHACAEDAEAETSTVEEYTAETTPAPTEVPAPVATEEAAPAPTEVPAPVATEEAAPTEEPEPMPTEGAAFVPTEVPAPVPTDEPTSVPAEADAPMETPAPVPAEADAPVETPAPVPAEAPASAEMPEPAPTEAVPTSFEQREQIGDTVVRITAPAGVMMPGSQFTIRETDNEWFIQAVLAVSQAEGDMIRHRVFDFSGAEINGSVMVEISEPLMTNLENQYPGAKIKLYVYAFQPDAKRLEDQAKRINADVNRNAVSFHMTEQMICDVMMVLELPASEPADEQIPETAAGSASELHLQLQLEEAAEDEAITEAVEEAPAGPDDELGVAESASELHLQLKPETEAEDETIAEAVEEAPAEPDDEPAAEADSVLQLQLKLEKKAEDEVITEPVEEAPAEPDDEPEAEAFAGQAEASEAEVPAEQVDEPEAEVLAGQDDELETEDVNGLPEEADPEAADSTDGLPDTATPEDAKEAVADSFTVTVSASYEGELHYGTTVVLTAAFSVDDPDAAITWEYSPDGGNTIFAVEGEHGDRMVYTYSEENKDYSWRVTVRRKPGE